MVKKTGNRRVRRRNNRPRRRATRMSSQPPLLPFNRILGNSVFRSSTRHDLTNDSFLGLDYHTQTIVSGYPQVVAAYKEMRVVRVNVWAYTTLSTASPGIMTMITVPLGLAQKRSTVILAAASPGAITRKVWQPLRGCYFPTEPTERDWLPIDTQHIVFSLEFYLHGLKDDKDNDITTEIVVVLDAHVLLRGQRNGVQGAPPVERYCRLVAPTTCPGFEELTIEQASP